MAWFQLLAFLPLAIIGWMAGRSAASRAAWWVAIVIPFLFLFLVILGHRFPRLVLVPPVSWAVHPDLCPLLMTAIISILFSTLASRLPRPRRRAVVVIAAVMLINYGLLPAALPLVARPSLAATKTLLDRQGVCRQTKNYTCGPAAAVTCLNHLGITSEEGTLAIAARCGPIVGTHASLLAHAVNTRFPSAHAQHRFARSIDDVHLPAAVETIMPLIGGHFIAVLAVDKENITIADPLSGKSRIPRSTFEEYWTGSVVEFELE